MSIYTNNIIHTELALSEPNIELFSYQRTNVCFNVIINNKSNYVYLPLLHDLEQQIFSEIFNGTKLWIYKFTNIITKGITILNLYINKDVINEYFNKSNALSYFLMSQFNKLPSFTIFDKSTTFIPINKVFSVPITFKLNLYDYQKKSLYKMIGMENNKRLKIEYTTDLIYTDILNVKYDPLLNIKTDTKRYFHIESSGGILADEMGLGKTITTLALIISNPLIIQNNKLTFSCESGYWKINSKATLIICPSHIAKQWQEEGLKCNPNFKIITILSKKGHNKLNFNDFIESDIIIVSNQFLMNFQHYPSIHYKTCTSSTYVQADKNIVLKKYYITNIINGDNIGINNGDNTYDINNDAYTALKLLDLPLFEYFNFHRLILDEGHEIFANQLQTVSISKYMSTWIKSINSNYKWFVSGSPFINYNGLVNCLQFLKIKLIDKHLKYEINENNLTVDKTNNFYSNFIHKKYILLRILEQMCIRHIKSSVSNEINIYGYNEEVIWISFTEIEKTYYDSNKKKYTSLQLQQLCCHPFILNCNTQILGDTLLELSEMQSKLIKYHESIITKCTISNNKLCNSPNNTRQLNLNKAKISESNYLLSIFSKLTSSTQPIETCSICLELTTDTITKCGHLFCIKCIKMCISYKNECPVCKGTLSLDSIYSVNKKEPQNNDSALIEKYGSKLGKIITMIKELIQDSKTRIIIFSQWDDMLTLIGKTLTDNGINNCNVKGNTNKKNVAIDNYIKGINSKVLLLSMKNTASGLNLQMTTHIFLVDPINASKEEVNTIEGQAIGRAVRINQEKKINVYRILLKDTIEEQIYNTYISAE